MKKESKFKKFIVDFTNFIIPINGLFMVLGIFSPLPMIVGGAMLDSNLSHEWGVACTWMLTWGTFFILPMLVMLVDEFSETTTFGESLHNLILTLIQITIVVGTIISIIIAVV